MKYTRAIDGRRVLQLSNGLQIRIENLIVAFGLVAIVFLLALFSLTIGSTQVSLASMLTGSLNEDMSFAVYDIRLPRILLGFMAGWCVAITGALLQSLSQNPLADPGLLGLSQGSMLTILLLIIFIPTAPLSMIPFTAILGGLTVAALLIWLTNGGQGSGIAILLMGIALETALSSISAILILYTPSETSYAVSSWLAGSLFQSSWSSIMTLAPWCALSIPVILFLGRAVRCYDLGDHRAMALGEQISRSRPLILFASVLLTSAAVAAVGPLSFLGVIAPHLANFISRSFGRARLILSGIMGGLLVIAADALTRSTADSLSLPIGLSLTLVGVPLFILTMRLRAFITLRTG